MLADGEADAAALARLRPHLKTCLSCRARLREFRAAPQRVAALVPVALPAGEDGMRRLLESAIGAVQQKAEALVAATHHKAAVLGERAQTAAELVTGQKVAALAASAAALAGGGTAVERLADRGDRSAGADASARRAAAAGARAHPTAAADARAAGNHGAGRSAPDTTATATARPRQRVRGRRRAPDRRGRHGTACRRAVLPSPSRATPV